jgi:hypothetical protein
MSHRDRLTLDPRSVTWVAMMAAGLLALAFVLGVQVGKQSAALRHPVQKGVEDEIKELPEPLLDQLKIFEGEGTDKLVPTPKVDATAPKEEPKPEAKAEAGSWTLQLVATPDVVEAKRVAAKAKAAGYATVTAQEKGQHKVRLAKPTDKATADKIAERLKKAGFKPFAVKAE